MNISLIHIAIACLLTLTAACGSSKDEFEGSPEDYETALRGTAQIHVDAEIAVLLSPSKALYDSVHPDAHISFEVRSALDIVNDLIDHRIRGAVIAREWLPQEDSIILADRGPDGFPKTEIAKDALVFYTAKTFPSDTLYSGDISIWLRGGTVSPDVYPGLLQAPVFVVPGVGSSVYGNVINKILSGASPAPGSVTSLPNKDSIVAAVRSNPGLIGIGYLSQFIGDTTIKMLRLSFVDDKGTYIKPKPVHASYLIMGRYPYPVPIYVVLKDRASQYSLPSGFALYMARDSEAQRTFFDLGIEPGYAHIELTLPE